jgi:hypothetical protein
MGRGAALAAANRGVGRIAAPSTRRNLSVSLCGRRHAAFRTLARRRSITAFGLRSMIIR